MKEIATRILLIIIKVIACDVSTSDSAKRSPTVEINKPLMAIAGTILTSLYFLRRVNENPPVVTDTELRDSLLN